MKRISRRRLLQWLFPRHCPLCDGLLSAKDGYVCPGCSMRFPPGKYVFPGGFAPFPYSGVYRDAVQRFKYSGRAEYAAFFAEAILAAGEDLLREWQPDVLLPVPIHRKRFRKRGYNQAAELARELAVRLRVPCLDTAVFRQKNTVPQNRLTPEERRNNLRQAFAVRRGVRFPETVLLVDDIRTTGSTLEELRRVAAAHGARTIRAVCICSAGQDRPFSFAESPFYGTLSAEETCYDR